MSCRFATCLEYALLLLADDPIPLGWLQMEEKRETESDQAGEEASCSPALILLNHLLQSDLQYQDQEHLVNSISGHMNRFKRITMLRKWILDAVLVIALETGARCATDCPVFTKFIMLFFCAAPASANFRAFLASLLSASEDDCCSRRFCTSQWVCMSFDWYEKQRKKERDPKNGKKLIHCGN